MTPITDDVSKLSSLVRRLSSPTCDSFSRRQQIWDANLSQTVLQKQNVPSDYEIPVSSISKDLVRKKHGSGVRVEPERMVLKTGLLILAGRQVLGGLKHIPFGAESSEPGRHVRRRLLQQGADQRLHIHAEEPPLHLQPRGAGEFPGSGGAGVRRRGAGGPPVFGI